MADVQLSFLRQLCRLKKSVTPAIMFRKLAEKPWVHRWWSQVLGFMHRLSVMPESRIHVDILKINNSAAGIVRQYASLATIVMGPCVFSCSTHVRRTLLLACCSSLIGLMRL